MTVGTALRQGTQLLDDARVAVPRLTAEVLLSHALKCERAYLYAHSEDELTELAWIHYGRYLHERIKGKPTQYITKTQEFYGRSFRVSQAVLIPRPETEHLVDTVLRLAGQARTIVDVGCGSGAIAVTLALELPSARVWGTDISAEALHVASGNAAQHNAGVHFLQCDLCAAIAGHSIDVLACNPPYVPESDKANLQAEVRDFEPAVALYGGPTGVEIYERLVPEAARVLKPGGWLIMELGFKLLPNVRALLGASWANVEDVADLAGIPRVLAARYQP